MNKAQAMPDKRSRLIRFRCTCGHCEDLKDDDARLGKGKQESFVLEGFQEVP